MPEALVNYLSLLSWSSASGEEFLPPARLVEEMDLGRMGASDAVFDPEKLRWLSGRYVQEAPAATLRARLAPFLERADPPVDPALLDAALDAVRPRVSLLSEVPEQLRSFAGPATPAQRAARAAVLGDPESARVLRAVADRLEAVEPWTAESLQGAVREAGKDAGAKGRALFHPVRVALTGEAQGPDLAGVLRALGRDRAIALLRGGPPFDAGPGGA
jgi:glutamyl/glutaminyl-tRNA synthetase